MERYKGDLTFRSGAQGSRTTEARSAQDLALAGIFVSETFVAKNFGETAAREYTRTMAARIAAQSKAQSARAQAMRS